MGIEPTFLAWEANVLPLNYTRKIPGFTEILQSGSVTSHGRLVESGLGKSLLYI